MSYQQYFHCFIVCILVLYPFWFSYQQNMVTILVSAASRGVVLIRGEALIRGRHLFQCGYPKVRYLFETLRLLEEIWYMCIYREIDRQIDRQMDRQIDTDIDIDIYYSQKESPHFGLEVSEYFGQTFWAQKVTKEKSSKLTKIFEL